LVPDFLTGAFLAGADERFTERLVFFAAKGRALYPSGRIRIPSGCR
jgi:hypothetical protein